jgi:polysaccharide biosynthesis protein PslH
MKILFIANEIPYPPDNGVRIVSYNAMRLMHERGHEIALAVLTEETNDLVKRFHTISAFCMPSMAFLTSLPNRSRISVLVKSLFFNRLFFVQRYKSKEFEIKLQQLIEKFKPDVIHFDVISMMQYASCAPSNAGTIASINDSYALTLKNALEDHMYKFPEKLYRLYQFHKTKEYEKRIYPTFSTVHLMSKADADYLNTLNPKIKSTIIPNGVDSSLFDAATYSSMKKDVVFVAKLASDNLTSLEKFLKKSWSKVHRSCPSINLFIIGDITPQALNLKNQFHNRDNVFFKGYATNIADAYKESGIAVVPINKNSGIINKAIEAMAAGHAVVGFEKTFAGITEAEANKHYITAPNYEEMSRIIIDLIENDPLRHSLQRSAHQLALRYYSWDSRMEPYERMYQSAINT